MPWNPDYYYQNIDWKTGPNRGPYKPVDKKKIKKYADAWARANDYKPQAASSKLQAPSALKKTQ